MLHRLTTTISLGLIAATSSPISADDPAEQLLVSAEQLVEREVASDVILDARPERDYKAGHLPGARWVDLNAWKQHSLSDQGLTDAAYWADQVSRLGISGYSRVVVYGGSPTDATRVWWTLKYLGVPHVSVLDGGFDAWVDAGASVARNIVPIEKSKFEPEFQPNRLATLDEMQSILKEKSVTIIDTRSEAEFAGTGGPGDRKGHIPGAVHQEWTSFVGADGRFKPVAEIRSLLEQRGLTPQTKAVTHCQSGGRASLNAFVMELAGYGPVKNYYCGWSEWSAAEDTPVARPE